MQELVTTDEGVESVASDEIRERCPEAAILERPFGFKGQLGVDGATPESLLALTTAHHVVSVVAQARAETLDGVREALAQVELPSLASAASFRVTTRRLGRHPFSSMDVQRAAGGALQDRYGTAVDLEQPEVNVRVDLYGDHLLVGFQRNEKSLGKRLKRARALRTAVKPTLAAAMIRLVGAHRGEGRLIDPMCGTGTIPVEAKTVNPALEVVASDWDEETVETARGTVANHGLPIEVLCRDVREPDPELGRFDYVVTDPPYGVRVGSRAHIGRLYSEMLSAFDALLTEEGRVAMLVLKFRAFLRALAPTDFKIVDERIVEAGGLHPRIFVLERGMGAERGSHPGGSPE